MAKSRTQVCFLLDETQSMLTRKDETIKGFNGYLTDLKKDKGDEVLFTLTTFNKGGIKTPYASAPINTVKELTSETYNPQNWTPLYDAIGATICAIKDNVKKKDLVIFVILTDGEENSSNEYKLNDVKDLVKKHEKDGWKFVFLGVGIDAFAGGSKIGLSNISTYDVGISAQATCDMYSAVSMGTTNLRGMNAAQSANLASATLLSDEDRKKFK